MHKFDQSVWDAKNAVKEELKSSKPSGNSVKDLSSRMEKIERLLNITPAENKK